MTDILNAVLDLIVLLFAVGLAVYGRWLSRFFKGGMLERPFRLLLPSILIIVVAEFLESLHSLGFGSEIFQTLHDILEILFFANLLVAAILIRRVARDFAGR